MKNLVVIVADTLRRPESLGEEEFVSAMPFLSGWRRTGFSLDRLVASSPWTIPSHVGLLTGMEPWKIHSATDDGQFRFPSTRSLAEVWARNGGESAIFSANPFVSPAAGTATGYETVYPGALRRASEFSWRWAAMCNERLVETQTGSKARPRGAERQGRLAQLSFLGGYMIHGIHQRHVEAGPLLVALNRFLRRRVSHRPLHLMINMMEAHEPYMTASFRFPRLSTDGFFPTWDTSLFQTHFVQNPRAGSSFAAGYMDALRRLDRCLAELVNVLRRYGYAQDSVVLFVSDHGQALGEHGFYGHGHELYDELVRVPGYLWLPNGQSQSLTPGWRTEWVDLRHVHDLLRSLSLNDADPRGLESALPDTLARRGPPISYWEGRYSHGTPFSKGGSITRAARLFSARGSVSVRAVVDQGMTRPEIRSVEGNVSDPELSEQVTRVVLGRSDEGPRAPIWFSGPTDGNAELESWGY